MSGFFSKTYRVNPIHAAVAVAFGASVLFSTPAGAAEGTTVTTRTYDLPRCDKPVASVMVGKLACKAAACQPLPQTNNPLLQLAMAQQQGPNLSMVGDGMAAMLTTALKETGCFDLQDREAMEEMAKELALVGKKMEVQQADFMISGAITSISMVTEKSRLGGGVIPIVGMISKTTQNAEIGVDVKVLDVNRGRVVEAKTFQANNQTSSTSFGGAGVGPGVGLIGSMQSLKGTPMEGIVRDVLAQVASFTAGRMVQARSAAAAPPASGPTAVAAGEASSPAQ
ncbi:CsgG/HfaB family protein [Inhella proteolytica]|uniref:Curli production assembly/transport component CsgG n=1 Tax=Inhella proteolytica TaxID=2795029 RepID=A0A931NIL1_9BURK|nr:CsgG/HfaB family protein [Inhella proteolytica]MBH9578149.1 hypothetical protein [Inhella proteolytica]